MAIKQKKTHDVTVCLALFFIGFPLTSFGAYNLIHYLNRGYHPYTPQSYIAQQITIGYILLSVGVLFCAALAAFIIVKRKSLLIKSSNQ
jgi:hypothetical protein